MQREVIPLGDDAFGVAAMIGERHFYTLLEEVEPGRLVGLFRVPFPRPAKVVDVKLAQFWGRDTDRNFVRLGRWKLALTPLTPETKQQGVLLRLSVPAEPKSDGAPRPIRLGYSLLIRAESRLSFGVVTFEMRIGESG